jgi:GNAT superfamily N-acetyltransferase
MSGVEIRPLRTRRESRLFLAFPWRIYANDPLWVPPLIPERKKAIDPRTGAFFKRGFAELFIAWRDGKPVGTICAGEDQALNERIGKRECIFGFFECDDDYTIAESLLDRAVEWADARGLSTLVGPFNLDYEDGYGILVEGRDRPPVMLCGHTAPYYQGFLERFGFSPLRGDNIAFEVRLDSEAPALARTACLAERIRRKGWLSIRTPDMSRWDDEIDVVHTLLNESTAHLPDYRPYEREAVAALLAPFRRIADPALILFVQAGGRTVGWFPGIANLNEILIHANGLRRPWDRLRLLPYLRKKIQCLTVKSVLILPEFWGSGAALLLIDELARRARAKGFTWVDLSLTSEDNPYTPALAKRMGGRIYKRYRLYKKEVSTLPAV